MIRKTITLAVLVAVGGLPVCLGCGKPDPTVTAAPPPSPNAPPPINASKTKHFAGARGLEGGGMAGPSNSGFGKPMAKPAGM